MPPMLIALAHMWQASSKAEIFLRKAKQFSSQQDIMQNLILAIDELTREVKRLDNEVRRVRRDAEVKRRF
jgi:competence protein ComGF